MKKLKVNFQKILCIIVSCVLAFSVITLPVSASSNSDLSVIASNLSGFLTSFKTNYSSYKSGAISFSDFLSNVASEASKRGLATGIVLTNAVDLAAFMSDLCSQLGVSFNDLWNDFYSQRHDLSNDDSILKGYGAVAEIYSRTSGEWQFTYYGQYGLISANNHAFMINGYWIAYSGVSKSFDSSHVGDLNDTSYYIYRFYGDWRFESDGSSASDIISDIPDKPVPGYDDESVSEDDLIDFIEDLINRLSLDFPDLSTIEGILAALLSEMKTLDHDDDTAALSAIQTAIFQLSSTNTADSEKIIAALNNMSSGGNFDFEKLITTLNDWIGLNGDYSEISKLEIVKDKFNKKIGFVSSFADLCGKVITAYTKTSSSVSFDISLYGSSHTVSFDWLEEFMPTFRIMLCAFIYISYAWRTFRKVPGYISGGGEN